MDIGGGNDGTRVTTASKMFKTIVRIPKPDRVVLKCGSIPRLFAAIEQQTGQRIDDTGDTRHFAGIPVVKYDYLPENIVVMTKNDRITHIFNLDGEP